ncbi:MAG TPA: DNA repair protein RecO [Longimicrobiales bacterium]
MALVTTEAIILQVHAYGDTSKILRFLTRSHGVRSAIAKGALRPRSRYGGVLEPFSVGTAVIYLKDGRDLQTLGGFELSRGGQRLGRDLVRFGAASLLAELVLRSASEEPDPGLFEQVRESLLRLEAAEPRAVEATALAATWSLIGRLGFAPSFDVCIGCDRRLGAEEPGRFDYAAGGVRCAECAPGAGAGRELPAHARATLARLAEGDAPPLERTAAHWALLAKYLTYHILDGGSLRSLSFLAETIDAAPCAS